jgi:hypothetical protein
MVSFQEKMLSGNNELINSFAFEGFFSLHVAIFFCILDICAQFCIFFSKAFVYFCILIDFDEGINNQNYYGSLAKPHLDKIIEQYNGKIIKQK